MSKRILLIDDEKDVISIIKKKLQQAGYEPFVAYNGQEGLNLTEEIHPHLILTDIAMPVMDGFVFYSELKNRQDIRHIPVIVSSAYGTSEERMRTLGVKDFLLKPYSTDSLLDKVAHFFKEREAFRILIATKMLNLMKTILQDVDEHVRHLDIHMTNNYHTIIDEALVLKPDLIIIDVDMFISPTADEVVNLLRQQESLKETGILLNRNTLGDEITSKGSELNKQSKECLANGASHFIGPLNKDSILKIVHEYCQK